MRCCVWWVLKLLIINLFVNLLAVCFSFTSLRRWVLFLLLSLLFVAVRLRRLLTLQAIVGQVACSLRFSSFRWFAACGTLWAIKVTCLWPWNSGRSTLGPSYSRIVVSSTSALLRIKLDLCEQLVLSVIPSARYFFNEEFLCCLGRLAKVYRF